MEANFALNTFRTIVAAIDRGIYFIIGFLYDIATQLSKIQIFDSDSMYDFAVRAYTLIGVVMLFKVTFSLISYLVNPDSISDKTNGAGNVAKNVVITLFLVVLVPYAFDFLYNAQNAILEDNILGKLILGTNDDNTSKLELKMDPTKCEEAVTIDSTGEYLAVLSLRPFYQLADGVDADSSVIDEYCQANSINALLTSDLYKADEGISSQNNIGKYVIDYKPVLSTACGILVLILLITACIEIALRAIKLGFLELIAPVPIISYVDPKSGKDGMFKKWTNEVVKTWVGLFVRLAVLYFAIYVVQLASSSEIINAQDNGIWITLFLIIGALMFVKQFPQLFEGIFGMKLDPLSLNPIKKIQEQATGGKQLLGAGIALGTGAIATVGGAGANLINNYKKFKEDPEKNKMTVKNTLGAVASGLGYGAYHGIKTGYNAGKNGKFNIPKESINAIQKASEDRNLNEALVERGVSKAPFAKARFMAKDKFTDVIGFQGKSGTTDEMKDELKSLATEKEIVTNRFNNARETISRLDANSSDLFKDVLNEYHPFADEYERDDHGNIKRNSDGGIEWANNIQTYEDFMRDHDLGNLSQQELSDFERDYKLRYNAAMEYRKSYNERLALDKKESKLTSEKKKFDEAKTTAQKSK